MPVISGATTGHAQRSVVRAVSWITGITGGVCWVALMALVPYFLYHRPAQPNPQSARIYALNEHGKYVYLTYPEHLVVATLPWAGILLLMTAAAVEASERASGKRHS
jgi:hypothetical protein